MWGGRRSRVSGSPAQINVQGDRLDAYYNFGPNGQHDHLASNDGINASYLREGGQVIVDDSLSNPYPG